MSDSWAGGSRVRVLEVRTPVGVLEVREEACRKDELPLVKEDCVRDHLSNRDNHKSMGSDRMHPQALRELADVIAEPLSIIFERSWRTGEVPEDWRKASVTPVFKKGKNHRTTESQNGKGWKGPSRSSGSTPPAMSRDIFH